MLEITPLVFPTQIYQYYTITVRGNFLINLFIVASRHFYSHFKEGAHSSNPLLMISLFILSIIVPEPSVTISGSPINDHFYTGLQLNLTCQVEFILPVDTELRLSTLWMKAHSNINSDRITVLGSERVSLNPMKYDSLLIFSPLSITSDDEGIYICSVSATLTQNSAYLEEPPDVMTNRTIMIESKKFALCNKHA